MQRRSSLLWSHLGADGRAFAQFLKIVDNYPCIGREATLDNPVASVLGAQDNIVHMNLVVVGYGIDLLLPLELNHRGLRHENGVTAYFGVGLYTTELSRPQDVLRVGKRGSHANRACLCIHLSIHKSNVTFARVLVAIRESQAQ